MVCQARRKDMASSHWFDMTLLLIMCDIGSMRWVSKYNGIPQEVRPTCLAY